MANKEAIKRCFANERKNGIAVVLNGSTAQQRRSGFRDFITDHRRSRNLLTLDQIRDIIHIYVRPKHNGTPSTRFFTEGIRRLRSGWLCALTDSEPRGEGIGKKFLRKFSFVAGKFDGLGLSPTNTATYCRVVGGTQSNRRFRDCRGRGNASAEELRTPELQLRPGLISFSFRRIQLSLPPTFSVLRYAKRARANCRPFESGPHFSVSANCRCQTCSHWSHFLDTSCGRTTDGRR